MSSLSCEGQPLAERHGGPIRTVVRERYFYKSLKWLEEIRVLAEDELGYWEKEASYHNRADPWQEQRYIVPHIDNQLYRRLLKARDFSDRELLGIRADGRNLTGLTVRRAVLRDAHFERSQLDGACFDGANLSNAHFGGARLRNASFCADQGRAADLEGADFRGADLRGADLTWGVLIRGDVLSRGQRGIRRLGPSAARSDDPYRTGRARQPHAETERLRQQTPGLGRHPEPGRVEQKKTASRIS